MKKLLSLGIIALTLTLTSCIDIVEEIFLNRNGSGRYLLTIDVKSIFGVKDMFLPQARLNKKDTAKIFQKTDTTVYLSSIADSVRRRFKRPELMDRASLRVKADESEGVMFIALEFPFNEVEEVNALLADVSLLKSPKSMRSGLFGFLSNYKVNRKSIERTTMFQPKSEKRDSLAALAGVFMAGARVKTIYHLPGKVKSTTIKEAYIRENECMVELTYPDFTTGKKSMDGKIIFK